MNKQQLASKIWASANKMRSKIEANEYKDYILGFIFYKFLSDTEVKFLKENDWTDEAIKEYLYEDKVPETVEQCKNNLGYFIAYPDLFSTWIAPYSDFGVADVRDALNRFARLISPAHQKVYKGIFDTLQNGLSKLGESTGAQTKAINNLLQLIKDIPTDGSEDYDVLGFIYEYLISNFAANAGKKAGEFYTPHEVALMMSEIVAHHLRDKEEITIYDPTSGSGSLLLNIGRSVGKYLAKNKITYYAQELKEATYNLTRMNLVMRGIHPDNILVRNGDTLEEDWPWFDDSDPFASYKPLYCDAVVSNPPYSQEWSPKEESSSDPRYSKYGVAPKGTADYAFLLHDLFHVKPDGIMTIVLPHGVLFRGGSEEEIRKNLIEKNNIDAIIGLPANIFFGTGIPTIVMVLRQKRENDDVLFVDASKGFAKVGKNNQLRARDIRKIVDAVTERREIPKFSRRVSRDTIRENDYNLNIPRYVNSAEADEQWDIYATMFGGIPNSELDAFASMWSKFPSLRAELFRDLGNGYSELIPSHDDLRRVIADNAEVRQFNESYAEVVSNVGKSLDGHLIDRLRDAEFVANLNLQFHLSALTSILFDCLKPFSLVDEYTAYQVLTEHWAQISGDLEIIHSEGLVAANAVDPNMVVKKKDGKDVEVQDGWAGRIIPIDIVERVMLSDELAAVENDRAALEATRSHIAETIENLPEAEGETPWLKEDGSAFVPKELKAKVKKIKQEYGSKAPEGSVEAMLLDADKSLDHEKKQKATYNAALVELISKAIETIENLTPDDIITLLKAKWSAPLNDALIDVDRQLINDFTSQLTSLSEKYSETLVHIDNNITSAEKSLASLIDNLTGSDNDMAGLREFQNSFAMSKIIRHNTPLLAPEVIEPLYNRASAIIEDARVKAYRQVNESLVRRNWELGQIIAEEELNGEDRAKYGASVIKELSKRLTATYGKGFSKSYLYSFVQFYKTHPAIFQSPIGKSVNLLSWTHYFALTQELNDEARQWYETEAASQNWSVRTLQRNISSQYYHRLLASQRKDLVEKEMLQLTAPLQSPDPTEFIKNPVIGEFLGFTADSSFRETDLEQSIIDNLEKFLLELGKGFAFVARQQHIHTEKEDYYIDLVFYNIYLKCYVLIDLKTSKIRHQDVGQMDMYVRMYDQLKRTEGDNPTIGILLCDDTDEDIARYSVLHDNDHMFASKYMTYMPSPEQLRAEIERQKEIYYLKEQSEDEE